MHAKHGGRGPKSGPAGRPFESAALRAVDEKPVTALGDGESARVVRIAGGERLAARLNNLGILPGKCVVKLGTMPGRGPVMLDCEGVRVALGRGIASHVIVEQGEGSGEEEAGS